MCLCTCICVCECICDCESIYIRVIINMLAISQSKLRDLHHCMCAGGLTLFGWEGWRIVFLSVGLGSIIIGALNLWQAHDPNYNLGSSAKLSQGTTPSLKEVWRETRSVMSIHTFLLIVIQVLLLEMPFMS